MRPLVKGVARGITNSGGAAASGPLVQDTFTDTNGTLLTAHTPDVDTVGGGWVSWGNGGSIDIQSNKASTIGGGSNPNFGSHYIDAGAADVDITSTYAVDASNDLGILVRYQDANNFWLLNLSGFSDALQISERNSGSWYGRASKSVTVTAGQAYLMRGKASGNVYELWRDGTDYQTYTDAGNFNIDKTKHGIWGGSASNLTADDYEINSA